MANWIELPFVSLPVSPTLVALFAVVVLLAGAVNGVAGFGFALVGTMALAAVVDPATAVVFIPLSRVRVRTSLADR